MGIITEQLKPTRTVIDDTELVRTNNDRDSSMELVFGHGTLALNEKCVFYKTSHSGHRAVTIIPFKNIDCLSVKTCKSNALLAFGAFFVLLAVSSGLRLLWLAASGQPFELLHSYTMVSLSLRQFWLSFLSLVCGFMLLLTYSIYRRVELMICTAYGNNRVKVLLPIRVCDSVEQFVIGLETQIRAA